MLESDKKSKWTLDLGNGHYRTMPQTKAGYQMHKWNNRINKKNSKRPGEQDTMTAAQVGENKMRATMGLESMTVDWKFDAVTTELSH